MDQEVFKKLLYKKKIEFFDIDPFSYPRVFKQTNFQFVVNTTPTHLMKILNENNYIYLQQNKTVKIYNTYSKEVFKIEFLKNITPKRIKSELINALNNNWATQWLTVIKENNLLKHLFPELYETVDLSGGVRHSETVFEHLINTLDNLNDSHMLLKLAGLLHDIGKPAVARNLDGQFTFHNHEIEGTSIAYNLCKRLGFNKNEIEYIVKMVRYHMFRFHGNSKDKMIKQWLFKMGKKDWKDIFVLRIADRKGNKANIDKPAITKHMKELLERIHQLINNNEVIFKEDLKISEKVVRKFANKEHKLYEIYTNLIGLVNQQPERNDEQKLKEYLIKVYK